jgi:nucleotide-binding universal stress UspA family protein
MTTVLAALNSDAAAQPVLGTALALAPLYDASVVALHVREDGVNLPAKLTSAAGVELQETVGSVAETLAAAAERPDVVALVLGARSMRGGPQPAGHTTLDVITRVGKPVVVVPPHARSPKLIVRILAPLDGTRESARAIDGIVKLAQAGRVEILVLHVYSPATVPEFADQAPHAARAREREFLSRNLATPLDRVKLLHRVGVAADDVAAAARETGVDLIALAWRQDFAGDSARVVSETLAHSNVPVLLLPVS